MKPSELEALETEAARLRRDIIVMNCHAGSGHPGGALSMADLITYLFYAEMNYKTAVDDDHLDRFVLSKGHACLALYAVLARKGFFDREHFKSLRQVGGMLQGHPDRLKTPGVEFNSGSLGQGFSFALGCALGIKRRNGTNRVYTILGDGELNEGQIWEGMMFAAHHQLDNFVAIVDYNKYQSDDLNSNITALEPLMDKFASFGWNAMEIDGHDFNAMADAFARAGRVRDCPVVILAHTVKGKGISFMENNPKWHGSLAPEGDERDCALEECGCEEMIS